MISRITAVLILIAMALPAHAGDSVVRICRADYCGTAFFIEREVAITASHILPDTQSGTVAIDGRRVRFSVLERDRWRDTVTLRIPEAGAMPIPICKLDWSKGVRFEGFEAATGRYIQGHGAGIMVDEFYSKRRRFEFDAPSFHPSIPLPPGASGSPILQNGKAVGILISRADDGRGIFTPLEAGR